MKKKGFRRVKVGNRGYVSGKRLQILQSFKAAEKKKKGLAGLRCTGRGKEESE